MNKSPGMFGLRLWWKLYHADRVEYASMLEWNEIGTFSSDYDMNQILRHARSNRRNGSYTGTISIGSVLYKWGWIKQPKQQEPES